MAIPQAPPQHRRDVLGQFGRDGTRPSRAPHEQQVADPAGSAAGAQRLQVVLREPGSGGLVLPDEGVDQRFDQVNQVYAVVEQLLEPGALVGVQ